MTTVMCWLVNMLYVVQYVVQHLNDEIKILPLQEHLKLHPSQISQKIQYPSHPLHKLTIHTYIHTLKKQNKSKNTRSQQTSAQTLTPL